MNSVDMRSHLHPDYDNDQWRAAIAQLEQYAGGQDAEVLHAGRNSVKKVLINDVPFVVKFFRNQGLRKKIGYKFRSGKARRSFEHAQLLIDAGLLSPQPVAWREDWHGGWLQQSFFVCAWVDAAFTAWDLKKNTVPDNERYVRLLGTLIGRMHNAGLHHQDLTPGNVLLSGQDDSFDIYFIDCNRMSIGAVSKMTGLHALVRMGLEGEHIDPYATAYASERGYDADWCCSRYRQLLRRHHWKWQLKNKTRPWRRKIGL